jgi:hypothetical protein
MPAFWVSPNRFPLDDVRSISGLTGSLPEGPGAVVLRLKMPSSPESRIRGFAMGIS